MGKDKSLEDLEAELAKMDAELAKLQSTSPPPKEKTSFLKRKKDAPAEPPKEAPQESTSQEPAPEESTPQPETSAEPAPEAKTKPGLFSKLKRSKERAPASEPAPAPEIAPPAPEKPGRFAALSRFGRKKAPEPAPVPDSPPVQMEPASIEAAPVAPPPPPAPAPVLAERIPPPTGTWVQEGKSWRRVAGGPPVVAVEGAPPFVPAPLPPPEPEPEPEKSRRRLFLLLLIPLALLLVAGLVYAAATLLGGGEDAPASTTATASNVSTPKGDLKAAFALSPLRASNSYKLNEAVRFDAATSVVPAGETATFEWDFGDGSKGNGKATSHVYRAAGDYAVTLTVSAAGSTAATTKSIKVVPPPTASLGATKAGGALGAVYNGEALGFSGAGSTGVAPLTYAWDFGDGQSATGETASHAFSNAGRFTVILTVTDGNGVPASRTKLVLVGLRMPLSGSAPTSAQGATTVPFTFESSPGFVPPVRIKANITYASTVGTGGAIGGLPVQPPAAVDELNLVLKDAQGNVIATGNGANGVAMIELTAFEGVALGGWTLEVQRPQGAATADKPFSGLLEVELPANA